MNLIFMGTSEFAVPILQALHASAHKIIQVYTTPPAQAGRGLVLQRTPVHLEAVKLELPVSCPQSLKKDPAIISEIKNLEADAIIVASYGRILPDSLLHAHKYGCINIHPSALPRWRGAAPIERTILVGDESTQVCIMKMDAGIDTGDVFLREEVKIPSKITAPELRDKLSVLGAELLLSVLENISQIVPKKQSQEDVIYAEKLKKDEGLINWKSVSSEQVERMLRAFNPWPGCFFEYKGEKIRILKAEVVEQVHHSGDPGLVVDGSLSICCGIGTNLLRPLVLQRPGKKPVFVKDFLNGFAIAKGTIL